MNTRHRFMLALTSLIALTATLSLTGLAFAQDKGVESNEKHWNPISPNAVLADVSEVEPNNSLATAQLLDCGNVLRPASIAVSTPRDTDYVYFNVTAGTIITVGTNADGAGGVGDTRIRLFNASGAVLASDDDSGPGLYSLLSFTATYTGTYYVGFAAFGSEAGTYQGFVNCTVPQPPPANDNCAGAIFLECGNINLAGTTAFATNDFTPLATGTGGCTGFTALGKDVVYAINGGGGDSFSLTYTNTGADGSLYLITNCASPTTSCVAGVDATLAGQPETLTYTFPSTGVYYLVLDSFGTGSGGAWTLTGAITCAVVPNRTKSWGTLKTLYR